jgi:hypothetical protein
MSSIYERIMELKETPEQTDKFIRTFIDKHFPRDSVPEWVDQDLFLQNRYDSIYDEIATCLNQKPIKTSCYLDDFWFVPFTSIRLGEIDLTGKLSDGSLHIPQSIIDELLGACAGACDSRNPFKSLVDECRQLSESRSVECGNYSDIARKLKQHFSHTREDGYVFFQTGLMVAEHLSEFLKDAGFVTRIDEIPHDDSEDGPWALSVMLPFDS